MSIADPKSILAVMPEKPGVYIFYDSAGAVIYVGKAKNLKHRTSSYFLKQQSKKTTVMLTRAVELKHIVVNTEADALLLENNLIKQYQPRYNILLKDDKTYPWICIKNERFPRVFSTRRHIKDGSSYFGPYTSSMVVKNLTELFRQLYSLRTCNLNLSRAAIEAGKYKVCLEYHIKNCKAPCIACQTEDEYNLAIAEIRDILKGNITPVKEHLRSLMTEYASRLMFEEADIVKHKLEILSAYQAKSTIVSAIIRNVDVFGMAQDEENSYINYLRVVNGAVVQAFTLEMKSRIDEEKEVLLGSAITELRCRMKSDATEIVVPFLPDMEYDNLHYTIPQKGDKYRLLELAERNATAYKFEQRKRHDSAMNKPHDRTLKIMERMKADFHLAELPTHIECFDNSNLMGTFPVASCVVFRNGRPSKKDYRKFNIKTVEGANDFASMEEIVYRRYRRLIEEGKELPQLIVVDGGKGQLSSAIKSLQRLGIFEKVAIVGIAKRLEEIYFPNDPVPLYIDKDSVSLKIVQQLRDEAHRFGITFHRAKRSKGMTVSVLNGIKGIGNKTIELLISTVGSLDAVAAMSEKELADIIGSDKARKIKAAI